MPGSVSHPSKSAPLATRLAIAESPTPSIATLPRETIERIRNFSNAEFNKIGLEIVSLDLDVVERKA